MSDYRSVDGRLRFAPEIVKRLGEELNPTLSKGILELAKNAYDADATTCSIKLQDIRRPGGAIIVQDNGYGMTSGQITDGWLVLGRSSKSPTKQTRLGRTPAGSKGLGRLAALRMGRVALLSTISKQEKDSLHELQIEWDRFDNASTVEDVTLKIWTRANGYGADLGTKIEIRELREGYGYHEVKRLARELILLADPFSSNPQGFYPELHSPEFNDLEVLIRNRYFDDAEYHLHAEMLAGGEVRAEIVDWKGAVLFQAEHDDIARRPKAVYQCPPATFDLWVFILNKDTFSTRQSTVGEVRKWLKEFGGVHIYCNGLRVSPYGGPRDDWLGMNLRRVKSPEERPGTNTSIGRIEVHNLQNQLVEKTDRSGFIENVAFNDLRIFASDAMEWMASCRLRSAEHRRRERRAIAPKESSKAKQSFGDSLAAVPEEMRTGIQRAFASYESFRDEEVNTLQKEVQLYRTLSTAGITAATFAHESNSNPIKVIWQSLSALERRAQRTCRELYQSQLQKPINLIKRALESLAVLSSVTLSLLDHGKRRNIRLELHGVLDDILHTYHPFLQGADVHLIKSLASGNPFLRGQHAAVESIIANLINNSVAAFEDVATEHRIIEINTRIADDRWCLSISDNGPGISGINTSDIWLPGRTTRKNGTGLGLTIVRDAVLDFGGSVEAIEHGLRGGAVISVYLPILGS